ncbi:MAG: YggS family pyridoxal phosphate-dependent enzyme [Clostridia bacterium]|nr:YggS family pyridoxal phosphate-dependent enzyme [Clostridia bacterium]
MSEIAENIERVRENIEKACERAGRKNDVTLIAVSKTMPPERVREAVDAGCVILGENRVQEMVDKMEKVKGARWHLIGHLQKNKVKYIAGKTELIHSIDSWELLSETERRTAMQNIVQNVLLEINISGEKSKYGLTIEEIPDIMNKIGELGHVRVRGLMTMAPKCENSDEARPIFRRARELFEEYDGFDILSMGMSGDYTAAVEEGATHVRVGSAIFGKRD